MSKAKLPALTAPATGNVALDRWIQSITEIVQVREGARGDRLEQVLTRRDLTDLGLDTAKWKQMVAGTSAKGVLVQQADGGYALVSTESFSEALRGTRLYQDLSLRLDDASRFNGAPDRIKALLLQSIADEAAQRGADVRQLEYKLQTTSESMAYALQEVTAAVQGATAGVRNLSYANATENRATAGQVTQVQVRLDDFDGGGSSVETTMSATADRTAGLAAEYMVKVSAGGAMAGFGLSASEDLTGATESAFIIQADKFAIVSPAYSGGPMLDPSSSLIPFGVDASGVYINGTVRINAAGATLASLAAATGIYISQDSEFFKYDTSGAVVNSTITLTANLTAGLPGTVTWSVLSGYGTISPSGNTLVLSAASMTGDTAGFQILLDYGGTTYTDTVTIVKLRDGANAISAVLSNEAHTVPANSSGTVLSFTGANTTFKVFQGIVDTTSAWTFSKADTGLTSSLTGSGTATVTATVTALSADVGTCQITAARSGYTSLVRVFKVTKAKDGAVGAVGSTGTAGTDGSAGVRGSMTMYASGSVWTDAAADAKILALTGASTRIMGDTVTISNGSFASTKYWSGSAWVAPGVVIDGNLLVSGTLSASKIAAGTISAAVSISSGGYIQASQSVISAGGVNCSILGTPTGAGIHGVAGDITTAGTAAVLGRTTNATGYGVYGWNTATAGVGVYGYAPSGVDVFAAGSGKIAFGGTSRYIRYDGTAFRLTDSYATDAWLPMLTAATASTSTGATLSAKHASGAANAQAGWLTAKVNGATCYIPYWT